MNATTWSHLPIRTRRQILRDAGVASTELERCVNDYWRATLLLGHEPRVIRAPRAASAPTIRLRRARLARAAKQAAPSRPKAWPGQVGVAAAIDASHRPPVFVEPRRR